MRESTYERNPILRKIRNWLASEKNKCSIITSRRAGQNYAEIPNSPAVVKNCI